MQELSDTGKIDFIASHKRHPAGRNSHIASHQFQGRRHVGRRHYTFQIGWVRDGLTNQSRSSRVLLAINNEILVVSRIVACVSFQTVAKVDGHLPNRTVICILKEPACQYIIGRYKGNIVLHSLFFFYEAHLVHVHVHETRLCLIFLTHPRLNQFGIKKPFDHSQNATNSVEYLIILSQDLVLLGGGRVYAFDVQRTNFVGTHEHIVQLVKGMAVTNAVWHTMENVVDGELLQGTTITFKRGFFKSPPCGMVSLCLLQIRGTSSKGASRSSGDSAGVM